MACYSPLKAFRTPHGVVFSELRREEILGDIEIPCGMCIGCRMRRASDWALRVMHEASLWDRNSFITLTYGEGKLPSYGSLDHGDFQKFMKRVRKVYGPVRFYMCGEYGPLNQRPHYHACIFNTDFERVNWKPMGKSASGMPFYTSKVLEDLWTHGNVSVQDLCRETAGYCARYIMKKALGEDAKTAYQVIDEQTGEIIQKRPEYAAMSLKPGIGARWYEKFGSDVFPSDSVVADGREHTTPKYYSRLAKKARVVDWDAIEFARQESAKRSAPDNTDARRKVREIVATARLKSFERNL